MRKGLDTSPEALAEDLLGRPFDELDEEEKRALCRVASTEIELDPDELGVVKMSLGDRMADRVAADARGGGDGAQLDGLAARVRRLDHALCLSAGAYRPVTGECALASASAINVRLLSIP